MSCESGSREMALRPTVSVVDCKQGIVAKTVVGQLGWTLAGSASDADIVWIDSSTSSYQGRSLKKRQACHRIPGMAELTRKKQLARNLARLARLLPLEYNFLPPTFLLPEDLQSLLNCLDENERMCNTTCDDSHKPLPRTFLLKPDPGSQGRGIALAQTRGDLARWVQSQVESGVRPTGVACQYVDRPMLLDGRKFDMRIYVLAIGGSGLPLRAFIFSEGLVRQSCHPYQTPSSSNLENKILHLTNWSIQRDVCCDLKMEANIEGSTSVPSKWALSRFKGWFREQGCNWADAWQRIKRLVAKTLLTVAPAIQSAWPSRSVEQERYAGHNFELLGYDILLDELAMPWLLEDLFHDNCEYYSSKKEECAHFEQILPSGSSVEQENFDRILEISQVSFLNDTAQGRLQRSLSGIRAKRLAAEEEKAAKVQQQEQRAASLKRWIIKECVRHRERKASSTAASVQGNPLHSSTVAILGASTAPLAIKKSMFTPGHPERRVNKQPQQAGAAPALGNTNLDGGQQQLPQNDRQLIDSASTDEDISPSSSYSIRSSRDDEVQHNSNVNSKGLHRRRSSVCWVVMESPEGSAASLPPEDCKEERASSSQGGPEFMVTGTKALWSRRCQRRTLVNLWALDDISQVNVQ